LSGGFPHSDIPGSKGALASPGLIAECHVLHRLLLPRHPPNALLALDPIRKKTGPFVGDCFSALPRFALLERVGTIALRAHRAPIPTRLHGSGVGSLDPMAPLGRCATVRRSERSCDQTDLTVSVLDLERLSLVSWRALRYMRTCVPSYRQTQDMPAPHLERTQKRLVYCSLNDVNPVVSRDPTAQHIRRCPGQSDRVLPHPCPAGNGGSRRS
jgi:hypothetical protein